MKYLIFFTLFISISTANLFAQTEYASVSPISAQSSYNDFADIDVTVTAGAGYYWFMSAVEYVDWQNGSSWENVVQNQYDGDWPYDGQWHTWSISSENIQITDIADKGNGTFKYKFSVVVNSASDNEYVTFSVTDVVAPSTPTGFSGSWDNGNEETGHPRLDWNANTEVDLKEYEVWKKVDAYSGGNIDPWAKKTSTTNTYYIDYSEIGWEYLAHPRVVYYKIRAVDKTNNNSGYTGTESFYCNNGPHVSSANGDIAARVIPNECKLYDNFPNPFNPTTTIHYFLPEEQDIKIFIYDVNGKKVQTVFSGNQNAGFHLVQINGSSLPSGLYYYQMITENYSETKRMLLVK